MGRCTLCGIYPFCNNIDETKVGTDNDCEKFIKRSLESNVQIYEGCKFKTGESNSKKS